MKTSGAAASGLVLGFYVPPRGPAGRFVHAAEPFAPNAFVRISTDNVITIIVNQSEMGQGVYTSLPMLIAEELDADWKSIQVEPAPVAPKYAHPFFGMQITGNSTRIRSSWQPFRTVSVAERDRTPADGAGRAGRRACRRPGRGEVHEPVQIGS